MCRAKTDIAPAMRHKMHRVYETRVQSPQAADADLLICRTAIPKFRLKVNEQVYQ
jgi:hypothetical protein